MLRLFPAVQRAAVLAAAATAFVLAGCSDPANSPSRVSAPDAASLSQSPDIMDQTGRHVFHTKQWFENDARQNAPGQGRGGGGGGGTGISYHGGPVLQSGTTVSVVYWAGSPIYNNGPAVNSTGSGASDGSLIGTFIRNLGGSPYFNINHSYTDGAGAAIANSVSYDQFWANSTFNVPADGANVSDANMLAMLSYAFNNGKLTYSPTTLYAIFTAGKVNLGGGFGSQYCAYHYHGNVTIGGSTRVVLYAAMPYDYAYPSACTNGGTAANGGDDPGADFEVNTLGHEIEETTTDLMGNAWFDSRGYENADKCAWNFGTTYTSSKGGKANMNLGGKDFLVQQNWVNAGSGGCALRY